MKEVSRKTPNNGGFTLIELLIVIVIIGILAGILITVLDPVRQQNRSRNATIRSAIQKIAYGLNSARSGTGRLPGENELVNELENLDVTAGFDDCLDATGAPLACSFAYAGALLPQSCTAGDATGEIRGPTDASVGSDQCYFRVISGPLVDGAFRVIGKEYELDPDTFGNTDQVVVFDSSTGIWQCLVTVDVFNFGTDLGGAGCTRITAN